MWRRAALLLLAVVTATLTALSLSPPPTFADCIGGSYGRSNAISCGSLGPGSVSIGIIVEQPGQVVRGGSSGPGGTPSAGGSPGGQTSCEGVTDVMGDDPEWLEVFCGTGIGWWVKSPDGGIWDCAFIVNNDPRSAASTLGFAWTGISEQEWEAMRQGCLGEPGETGSPAAPTVNWTQVIPPCISRELTSLPHPEPAVGINPGLRGLTGLPSYFWVERLDDGPRRWWGDDPIVKSVDLGPLCGYRFMAEVRWRPTNYHWEFGDGAYMDLGTAGCRYQDGCLSEVRYTYERSSLQTSERAYPVTVTVEMDVEFRVPAAGINEWQPLGRISRVAGKLYPVMQSQSVLTGPNPEPGGGAAPVGYRWEERQVGDYQAQVVTGYREEQRQIGTRRVQDIVGYASTVRYEERPASSVGLSGPVYGRWWVENGQVKYQVASGDTLWAIAAYFLGNPWRYGEIASLNGVANPHWIYPGQVFVIPISPDQLPAVGGSGGTVTVAVIETVPVYGWREEPVYGAALVPVYETRTVAVVGRFEVPVYP